MIGNNLRFVSDWISAQGFTNLLLTKLTALLTSAWVIHLFLGRTNPRWRVLLWRGTLVGLVVVAVLSTFPPQLGWRARRAVPPIAVRESVEGTSSQLTRPLAVQDFTEIPSPAKSERSETRSVSGPWISLETLGLVFHCIWLIGAVFLSFRLMVSALVLRRIVATAEEAPPWIEETVRRVAERLTYHGKLRVRRTSELSTPCLAGLQSPTLLLTKQEYDPDEANELLAVLAHELAHARNHDLAWNLTAHLAAIALWFHPLIWRLRSAHASACEAVSDAMAVDDLGDTEIYVRTLARIALGTMRPAPVSGLTMARGSDVAIRIRALKHFVHRSELSRSRSLAVILFGGALVAVLGTFGVLIAQEPVSKPNPAEIVLQLTDPSTGQPTLGVPVQFSYRLDGRFVKRTVATDSNGAAKIELPPNTELKALWITARKQGYVPIQVVMNSGRQAIRLPFKREYHLEKGSTISGVVKDGAGKPVADASVTLYMAPTESDSSGYATDFGHVKTDANGVWKTDEAPQNFERSVTYSVDHPDFLPAGGPIVRQIGNNRVIGGLGNILVLERGHMVSGRVLDDKGQPIANASVIIGLGYRDSSNPITKTNAQGAFLLKRCRKGPAAVVVESADHAPALQMIEVGDRKEPLEYRLDAGMKRRIKVVDHNSKPLPSADLYLQGWRGQNLLQGHFKSDTQGRIEWAHAPADPVKYSVLKEGYMAKRDLELQPATDEQVVQLMPKLVISGRVADAKTGQPIREFQVIRGQRFPGRDDIYWMRGEAMSFRDGQYEVRFDEGTSDYALKVTAADYREVDSRAFRSEEGAQNFDFKLERAQGFVGVVRNAEGEPAIGVDVVVATHKNQPYLSNGAFNNNGNIPHSKTDSTGTFRFPVQTEPYVLMGVHEQGFARATAEEFTKSQTLVLKPWGRIRGEVMVGSQRGSGQPVTFQHLSPNLLRDQFVMIGGNEVTADEKGRFVINHIIPGEGRVGRVVITKLGGGMQSHAPGWMENLTVVGGETARVNIGGKGRPVIGQVVLDGKPDVPFNWQLNTPVKITPKPGLFGFGPRSLDQYLGNLDQDGRFRVDDVPPGNYSVTVVLDGLLENRRPGLDQPIGAGSISLEVPAMPDGRSDEVLDVGTVTAKLIKKR